MALIIYGRKTLSRELGYVGEKTTCPHCGKTYKKSIVRYRTWIHIYQIPLIPVKSTYYEVCPVCCNGNLIGSKEAKAKLAAIDKQETQSLSFYAKHILANKPKNILTTDQSYEFWMKDNQTGEETCLNSGISKSDVNNLRKERGLKDFRFIKID